MGRLSRHIGFALAMLVFALPASAHAAAGCDASRPAVAHRGGGVALSPQPPGAPIPCASTVGPTVDSANVGVARDGSVYYGPVATRTGVPAPADLAVQSVVARSTDAGATWRLVTPGTVPHGSGTPWLSVDPTTSRIWYATPPATFCGATISWSDDGGRSWHDNPIAGCPGLASNRVLEGPAPAGGAKPSGYAHVVYYCANGDDVGPSALWCFKSLDGGTVFTFVGGFPDPSPPTYSCGTLHAARPGVVAPDGTLYFPVDDCGNLELAVSHDEGLTWTRSPIAATNIRDLSTTSVATDGAGNLYVAWLAAPGPAAGGDGSAGAGLPYLSVSRDHGRSWTKPLMVAAPGVDQALRISATAVGSGDVAVAYLGSSDGGSEFDGYITTSADALASRPLFWSAPVNDPRRPLMPGAVAASTMLGNRMAFMTSAFGPDRTPWAAFHCAGSSACPSSRVGVVGRLVRRR